ncbi:MAG: PSD1 and planctomycete cytochrome C domain-containing protein [Bryobacteraceae bacterium]|nr:PSD1 and planctomycete cytochrome C domain-containing protein [Bryobacteraceae bacterium]MDW8379557.1 PSD1 and planctomycete cytochrome C domain-containing protein [Bryobacterales bacterium]
MTRWLALFILGCEVWAQPSMYETKVQPILRANCLACHSEKNLNSGLSLETRESILQGGNRGAVVKLGAPEESLLIAAVRHTGSLKMPPGKKLSDEQIAALEEWIRQGLPMPASLQTRKRPGMDHWAFQYPKRVPLPSVRQVSWPKNAIDYFILERIEKANLKPSAEASRAVLLRRVSLDLIGLPPTPEELAEFLADTRPDAYERVVDRLLASPHYGERWGRHWLDVARYADTDGYTIDAPRDMWPYRDWVIQALNRDQPFDEFIIEQFAGDLLPNPSTGQLIATGFHRNTPSNYEGGIDFEQYRVEAVADRVNTTGSALMGLTLACARCHDHKYDPISQREYYQMFAFLNNVDEIDKEAERKDFNRPFLPVGSPEDLKRYAAWEVQLQLLENELNRYRESLPGEGALLDPGVLERQKNIDAHRRRMPPVSRALIMRELPQPRQTYIHLGGDFTRRGASVEPGTPAILPPLQGVKGRPTRLDFAKWLVDKRQPLTARVTVNRIWQKYFGRGIVDTENDFGLMGDKPSHPELLDYLALEFMDRGWSQKQIHRLIVTSATYRQSSQLRPDLKAADPENRLFARQNRLRLDAEVIRDSALLASGLLSRKLGGPSVFPPLPAGANAVTQVKREWKVSSGEDRYRRGLYTFFQRSAPHPALVLFDAPDATVTCTRRIRSNSPLQALTLLNDEAYFEFAEAFALRLLKVTGDDRARLKEGFLYAVSREPSPSETARLERLLAAQRDAQRGEKAAWTAVARVLLNLDEFMTRE